MLVDLVDFAGRLLGARLGTLYDVAFDLLVGRILDTYPPF